MNAAIVALLMSTAPAELPAAPHAAAVATIAADSQTGSLLFSQGDCLAVRAYTSSPYTHVATLVCNENGPPLVYDSMNGAGVRKMTLEEYIRTQSPDRVRLFHPQRQFTPQEVLCFREHLDSQIGRPYAVKHHLTGKRANGVHCAEYVTDALLKIEWLKVQNPPRVSPASLAEGITVHQIYQEGKTIEVPVALEPIPEPEGRCERLWMETKVCVKRCCSQLSSWIICR